LPKPTATGPGSSKRRENKTVRFTQTVRRNHLFMIESTKSKRWLSRICRIIAAIILLQTLFFKFTGAAESVYIFTKVGMEPWGRYATGVMELVASVLLLIECKAWMGALIGLGVISGAIVSHLTVLGIWSWTTAGFCSRWRWRYSLPARQ